MHVPVTAMYFHADNITTVGLHCSVLATETQEPVMAQLYSSISQQMKDGVQLEEQHDALLGIQDVSAVRKIQEGRS